MENTITELQKVNGFTAKIYGTYDEPLFLAKEVAEMLGHSNSRMMLKKVDEDEKVVSNVYTHGGEQKMTMLTEDGLYEVLFVSRKPIAKAFKKEVKTILKEVRKHGAYLTNEMVDKVLDDPDTIIRLATQLKEERAKTALAEQQIKIMEPKVNYHDTVLNTKSLTKTTMIAKDYGLSAVKFNSLLHDLGVQYKQGKDWLLYADYQKKGWMKSKTSYYNNRYGQTNSTVSYQWTQKGRLGLYELLKSKGFLPLIEQNALK